MNALDSPEFEFATIEATFQPVRTDDLRPEAAARIGERLRLTYAGRSDDDEAFPGQARWMADTSIPWFGWCPSEDLTDYVLVTPTEY